MAKRKKKRVFKIKNIIIILVVFILLICLFWYFIRMPIKNIYVNGNNLVSDGEILSLSGLDKYPSFILSNRRKIEESILKNDYIESVKFKKKFGNIVELDVVECNIIAISLDGKIIVSSGKKLKNVYKFNDSARLISEIDGDVYDNFVSKFIRIDDNILRDISEIEYSPVSVDSDRFILYMNDGNIVHVTLTKIEKLNKYNDIKDELSGRKGIIYLDSGDYVELKS